MPKELKVLNHEEVRTKLKEYYRDAELWLPPDHSRRIYKVQGISEDDGKTYFHRIRDRITSKKKLRKHLIKHTPLNVYFSTSCWLNPTKTRHKTYDKDWDGRRHFDKNGFMYGDYFVDKDDMNKTELMEIYQYIQERENLSADDMTIVFSGGGFHINIWKWYRNRDIANPIEKEKQYQKEIMEFTEHLVDKDFNFDYSYHAEDDKLNCPSVDTRRVRKLPNTVTKYGNLSEVVEDVDFFEPTQVISEIKLSKTRMSMNKLQERLDAIDA